MKRTHTAKSVVALLALAASLTAAPPAAADGRASAIRKLDPVLMDRAAQLAGRSRVIVDFTAAPDVRVFDRGAAGRRVGASAQVGEVHNFDLLALASDPRVRRVMVDRPAIPTLDRTGAAIGATAARAEFDLDGSGVGIAIIDSGITAYHDDLYLMRGRRPSARVVHFRDFTKVSSTTLWTSERSYDEYGHGTHVAGIIAGSGYDSKGARTGVAPGARLIGLKVLDATGNGYVSDVIAALDYAVSIRQTYDIRVINLSVASAVIESYTTDPLALAARRATDAGIVVVAAAGNLGRNAEGETQFGGITSPGNAPWVLTVGAASHEGTKHRSDDVIGSFSSRGPTWIDFGAKPDLVAPGVGTESLSDPTTTLYAELSAYLLSGTAHTSYKPYLSMSGTSMAAPVVTGTIALMMQANPALTPNAVKAILQYTAQVKPGEEALAQGAGMLNARGAIRMARFFGSPESGVGDPADVIEGETVPWAQHLIWGNYRITGGVPLPGSNAWDLEVPWGALEAPDGAPVVWGASSDENIVWSTDADQNIVWSTTVDENIVWSTAGADENIVWSTTADENIVWSTMTDENIVWSTAIVSNLVWGNDCAGRNCAGVVWGARDGDFVWGTSSGDENIVWSTDAGVDQNIVWSTTGVDENIVWSTMPVEDQNIVWSTATLEQMLWSASTN